MPQSLLPAAELALRWLMQSAWQAGLLAAGVLAITWLCGNWLEPRWRFALWLVVFVRLALPMAPAAPWSVFGLMHFRIAERSVDPSNSFAAVVAPRGMEAFGAADDGSADDHGGAVEMPAPRVGKANELTMDDPRPPRARMASPLQAAALIWLAGVVALAFRWLASVWRLSRQQRQWQLVTDSGVLALLESCCRELPLRRTVSLYLTPEKIGPATCGVIRPRIVLPERLLTALSHGELRLVLLHELVHVRRHDVLIDQLASLVTIVHWFHPVAWLARYCLRRERELACDAAVLDRLQPHAAADYGHAILKTVESLSRPASSYGLVGMFSSGPLSLITRRIRRIADYRRTTRLSVALGGLFLVAFSLTGLTDAQPQPARSKLDAQRAAAPQSDAPVGAAKPEDDKEESDSSYSVPITVTGRAVDLAGKPVTAAEIFLASPRTNGEPLAKTKTDADGAYRFDKVPLPIKRADTHRGEDVGLFELFGRAEEFGFTWRPHKWFYPNSAHVDGIGSDPTWDLPYRYGREDPIELDLQFGPPAMLQGRVVNDLGEPLAAARLAIRRGQPLDDERSLHTLESFNWPALVPRELKFQVADDQGRFTFANLPEDCKFWIDVRPEGHSPRSVWAATSGGVGGDARGERIYSGDIELVFPRPRVVKMRVLYGDTGKPAAKVGVGGTVDVAGFWETTDDDGFAEASLPDGRYSISVFPRYGTPYLRTQFEVVVSVDSVKEPATVKLRPAAVVEITVVDSDTREPLPGTDVWLSDDPTDPSRRQTHGYRSWEVETRISHYEAPRSDKNGKMRVLVEPGERLIGVGLEAYPKGYEPVDPDGKRIDCRAGEPMAVEFQMKKKKPVAVQQPQAPPTKAVTDRRPDPSPGRILPTTIGGRALDESGQSLAGATIYLIMRVGWSEKLLGEAFTGPDGRFVFRDAPLQAAEKQGDSWETAWFRLAGHAPGRAIAWRGIKHVYFDPSEAMRAGMGGGARPDPRLTSYMPGERIELDLAFPPPQPIVGRVLNETGQPISGAKVSIGQCFYVDAAGKPMNEPEAFRPDGAWLRTLAKSVEEQLATKSDSDGKFELPSLPPGVVCDLSIKHPSYALSWLYTSTADNPPATHQNRPVVKLPLELKLRSVRTVPVIVMLSDTDKPVADVSIDANELVPAEPSGGGSFDGRSSDKDGKLTLKLPPGKYKLRASPPLDINYIRTEQEITVDESPVQQPVTVRLKRGCHLVLKAVDADSGAPIPGVYFRSKEKYHLGWIEVSAPPTNDQGEVRAVAVPGSERYINGGNLPPGYEAIDPQEFHFDGRLIELPEGETVTSVFKLRKR